MDQIDGEMGSTFRPMESINIDNAQEVLWSKTSPSQQSVARNPHGRQTMINSNYWKSPMFKFLELRFYYKLKRNFKNTPDRNQTGFVPGMGKSVNIQLLIQQLKNCKEEERGMLSFYRLQIGLENSR